MHAWSLHFELFTLFSEPPGFLSISVTTLTDTAVFATSDPGADAVDEYCTPVYVDDYLANEISSETMESNEHDIVDTGRIAASTSTIVAANNSHSFDVNYPDYQPSEEDAVTSGDGENNRENQIPPIKK
nr:unnamed protein product [Callosobruchus chinensis]